MNGGGGGKPSFPLNAAIDHPSKGFDHRLRAGHHVPFLMIALLLLLPAAATARAEPTAGASFYSPVQWIERID